MMKIILCKISKISKIGVLLMGFAALSACETMQTVQPWEKGKLARPEMKFDGDQLDARFVDHIYFSKEAASGGAGVGGGGCGCN
jgi:Domain of unknown function (DUF4266)